jgi:hypothetical protein
MFIAPKIDDVLARRLIRRATIAALALACILGCGDGRPRLIPVSGRVSIDGRPVEHGNIRVYPDSYRAASAKLGPGGRFELSTYEPGDGCLPGKHAVTVNALEVIDANSQRWHAPKNYRNVETSGLLIEIDNPTDSVKIELTWAGKKPFVEKFRNSGD